jgi:hypothetical protein
MEEVSTIVATYYSESELCGGAVTFFSKKASPRTFQTALAITPPSWKGFF